MKYMTVAFLVLAGTAIVYMTGAGDDSAGLAACNGRRPTAVPTQPRPETDEAPSLAPFQIQVRTTSAAKERANNTAAIFMSNDLMQAVGYEPSEKDVTFYSTERAPGAALPEELSKANFSTSYEVKKVVHAGKAHTFYLNGRARNGDDVIELWEVSVADGAYYATRPVSTQPIGTPTLSQPLATGLTGGYWIHPTGRTGTLTASRTELYRGSGLGFFRGIAADPDGRFLLILAGDSLYRLEISSSLATPVEILTTLDFLALARADFVQIGEQAPWRVAIIHALAGNGYGGEKAWLTDGDNDGVFEGPPVVVDEDTWASSGLADVPLDFFVKFF